MDPSYPLSVKSNFPDLMPRGSMYEVKNSENKDMFLKYCCTVSFHFSPGYTQQEKNKQQRGVARGGAGWREVSGRAAYASFTR